MKQLLLVFILSLAACSEGPEVPSIVLTDNANARIAMVTCQGKSWEYSGINENYTFGSVATGNVYPTGDIAWPVAPYQITLTFQNLSTTTSVKIKVPYNAFGSETLSPGETYTPSNPMFSMTCSCEVPNCPSQQNVSHDYTFKVSNIFGNQTPVDIRVGYIINSPHGWYGSSQTALDVTHWQP